MTEPESMDTISKLEEIDPVFCEVTKALFGDAVDPRELWDISKMGDPSEYHVTGNLSPAKRRKRERKIAATGIAATTVATAGGAHAVKLTAQDIKRTRAATKAGLSGKGKLGLVGGAAGLGWMGLHGTELAADGLAYRANYKSLQRNKEKKKVSKNLSEALEEIVKARRAGQIDTATALSMAEKLSNDVEKGLMARPPRVRLARWKQQMGDRVAPTHRRAEAAEHQLAMVKPGRRALVKTTAVASAGAGGAVGYKTGKKKGRQEIFTPPPVNMPPKKKKVEVNVNTGVSKADEVDYAFTGEISKFDTDKRLAFGWCSLSEVDGQPVLDLQGDYAPIEEIEKSAYAYVQDSRVGGDMHARDGLAPKQTSSLVESFIATPEKLQQMGLSEEVAKSVPVGWWVGFKVDDDEQWAMVKDGRRAGFSIHGKGSRVQKALES